MDVAIRKVLTEEVIKLLLFCRGQGEHLGAREFIKGFLREDISEVMVLDWHHTLEGLAFLSLLGLLG